jgi:nicotinate-nucleotide adenylyltransferase
MKVAVYGGSFDPPHIGHEEVIKKAIEKLDIEVLFVIPTFLSPFKRSFFTPASIRYKWVEKLLLKHKKAKILDYEISQNRSITTIQTIKYISEVYNPSKIYLIIGADNIEKLSQWHKFEELKKMVQFVVASRDDIQIPKSYLSLHLDIEQHVSSTSLRKNIDEKYLPKIVSKEILNYYQRGKMDERIKNIVTVLDNKKAENIQVFDMKGSDYFAQRVIIATTLGSKHGLSLLDYLKNELKPLNETFLYIEENENWSVIDLGDILIHLMTPEYRTTYNIEDFLDSINNKIEQ